MNMVTTLYLTQIWHIYGGGLEGLAYYYGYRSLGCCLVTDLMVRPGRSMAREMFYPVGKKGAIDGLSLAGK